MTNEAALIENVASRESGIMRARVARVSMALPVIVASRGVRVGGTTLDLGVGGAFIETLLEPAFDATVDITLRPPGIIGELRLPALVRWKKVGGIGVQFLELGARETYTLASLVKAARGGAASPYLDLARLSGKGA